MPSKEKPAPLSLKDIKAALIKGVNASNSEYLRVRRMDLAIILGEAKAPNEQPSEQSGIQK